MLTLLRDLAGGRSDEDDGDDEFRDVVQGLTREERSFFGRASVEERRRLTELLRDAERLRASEPLRFRVLKSALPDEVKHRVSAKLARQGDAAGGDAAKFATWIETALALPLGLRTARAPRLEGEALRARLDAARAELDGAVYGHRAAKQAVLERLFSWLAHPDVPQRPLGLVGPPGNGKTTLVQKGLAAAMGRPFFALPLGGSSDASTLVGHGFTYEGSQPGRVAEALVSGRVEDPVLYFDELDKVSGTARGEELANVLVHLTDVSQNRRFQDRYLHGIDLDLSGALLVFSFNDASALSKVLLDRLQLVRTDGFGAAERRRIAQDYLLPSLLKERGLPPGWLRLDGPCLDELCAASEPNAGVRKLRAALEAAVTKLHAWRSAGDASFLFPLDASDVAVVEPGGLLLRRSAARKLVEEDGARPAPPPHGMYG